MIENIFPNKKPTINDETTNINISKKFDTIIVYLFVFLILQPFGVLLYPSHHVQVYGLPPENLFHMQSCCLQKIKVIFSLNASLAKSYHFFCFGSGNLLLPYFLLLSSTSTLVKPLISFVLLSKYICCLHNFVAP